MNDYHKLLKILKEIGIPYETQNIPGDIFISIGDTYIEFDDNGMFLYIN